MSSYKGHSLFAVVLSLLMFHNPLAIAISLLSANFPDFDHEFKRNQVLNIFLFGVLITVFLYILNLPYYFGLILIALAVIFLLSSHRGFTHSIFGIIIQALAIFFLIFFTLDLFLSFNLKCNIPNLSLNLVIVFILLGFLGLFFLNRKLSMLYISFIIMSLLAIYLGLVPAFSLDLNMIVFSIFLGLLSHLILDSFTPSGIKAFSPFTEKSFHKWFGIIVLIFIFVIFAFLF